MGYALRMSAEIRDWLVDLRVSDPRAAAAVGHALVALADEGPALGPPTVTALGKPPLSRDPADALDEAYQVRLERLRELRHEAAGQPHPAAGQGEYLSLQAEADAFRVRKEVLRARYMTALAEGSVARFLADADDDGDRAAHGRAAAEHEERVASVTAEIERELGIEPWPDGLYELRPAVPGGDIRLIVAVEPADAVLVISVLEGGDAVSEHRGRAVEVSAQILRRVRAGQDPEASAVEFAGGREFAGEFVARDDGASEGIAEPSALTVPWLPFPLAREGYPRCEYQVADDSLILTAAASTDLFVDPAGASPIPDAGRLVGTPPGGDFTLAARVTVDFGASYDAAALLLYATERVWAKLCFELSPQRRPTVVTVVTRGTSDDCNSFDVTGGTVWLRVTRSGAAWALHASADGQWWQLVRYFSLGSDSPGAAAPDAVKAGFLAQSPTGQGCTATFERIAFRQGAPSDLRDGS